MKIGIAAETLLAGAVIAGCVERKPATVAFSIEEAAFIKKSGTGIIA